MANYNVDIEVALKGAQNLREFNKSLRETTRLVGKINGQIIATGKANKTTYKVASIDNYRKAVDRALRTVNKAALGTQAHEAAVENLVKAKKQLQDATDDQKKLYDSYAESLGLVTRKTNAAANATNRLAGAQKKVLGPASPIRGAKNIPGSPLNLADKAKKRSAAVTAGAFPLLFGGGPFQAIGGAIGGELTGNMFGGATVALQVLGGSLDTLASNAVALSASLDGAGDASAALEMFVGRLDSATKSRITTLQQSGQTALAADAAFKELSDTIGETSARGIVQAGKDFEFLGDKIVQVSAAIGGFLLNLGQEALGLVSLDPTATGEKETKEFKRVRADAESSLVIAQLETLEAQAVLDKEIERTAEIRKRLAVQVSNLEIAEVSRQLEDKAIDQGIAENRLKVIQEKLNRELLNIDNQRLTAVEQRTKKEEADAERKRREAERAAAEAKRKQDEINRGINSQLKASERLSIQVLKLEQDKLATEYDGIELLVEQFQIEKLLSVLKQEAINAAYERNKVDAKSAEEQLLMLENKNTEIILERELLKLKSKNLQQTIAQAQAAERARDLSAAAGFNVPAQAAEDRGAFLSSGSLYGTPETMFPIEKAIEYDDSLQKILDKYPQIQQTADIAAASMTTGLTSLVEGTKTAEEVFADFLRNISQMLLDAAKQMIATYIAIGVARMFAGVGFSDKEILSKSSLGSDGGGIFSGGFNVPASFPSPRALGGSVSSGRPYLVGERGPELFVPGAQGNIVPNNAMGGSNIVVNVDASGSQAQGDSQRGKQLGAAIGAAVQAELIKQKRPGGLLAS